MSHKQKQMFALLLALLLLTGGALWAVRRQDSRAAAGEAPALPLSSGLDSIVRMETFSPRGLLVFQKETDAWVVEGQEDYPLDSARVQTLADMLQELTALQTLEESPDSLEAYGLAQPACWVTVTDAAGSSLHFDLGANIGGSNYLRRQGEESIHLVSGSLASYLSYSLEELFLLDALPALTDSSILSFTLEGAHTLTVTPVLTESTDSEGYTTSQTQWFCGETEVTENESLAAAVQALKRLAFGSNLDYSGSEAALEQYGLAAPQLRLQLQYRNSQGENCGLTLAVGRQQADGSYAARLEGSRQINTVAAEQLDALLALSEQGLP